MATMNTALWTTERQTEMYRFFSVAFNAAPGTTYMDQLYDAVISGMSTKEIVNVFVTKSEFTSVYPRSMTNANFASKIVDNVVGSSASATAKAAAVADITAALTAGMSRGDIVYQIFTNLATKPATDADWAGTSKQMANQVEVARYYTETLNKGGTDLTTLQKVVAGVTATTDTSSVAALAAVIDTAIPPTPLTLALTTAVGENIKGGSGADTITASTTTLNAYDSIDGGAGSDTFNYVDSGAIAALPAGVMISGVETMRVTSGTTVGALTTPATMFDSSSATGLTSLVVTSGAGTDAIKAASSTDVQVTSTGGAVLVNGGKAVSITTDAGQVNVGYTSDGSGSVTTTTTATGNVKPAGAVSVTATTSGNVLVNGGTDVTVVGTDAVTVAAATGKVSVTGSLRAGDAISVTGGTDVTVASTGANASTATITVGSSTAAPTGTVKITDTLDATSTGYGSTYTSGAISVVGGVSVEANQVKTFTVPTAGGAPGTVTFGAVAVTGGAATSSVTVTQSAAATAVTPVTETGTVTFPALVAGESVTVAGLTFTAGATMTAADVAGAFASLAANASSSAAGLNAAGSFSGALTGYSSTTVSNTNQVVFTSATPFAVTTDLAVSSSNTVGTAPTITITQGSATVTESAVVTFQALRPGQTFSLGGVTVRADTTNGATAAQVASYFAGLANGQAPANTSALFNTSVSGTALAANNALSGWSTGAANASNQVTFTSSQKLANVTDLAATQTKYASGTPTGTAPSITVTQSPAIAVGSYSQGVAAVGGVTNAGVTITDANATSLTAAGTIANVSLTNFGAATANSSALSNVTLAGKGTSFAHTGGALTTPTLTTETLTLNGATLTGSVTLAASPTTVNVVSSGSANAIVGLSAAGATTLNISGTQNLTTGAITAAKATTVSINNTGSTTIASGSSFDAAASITNSGTGAVTLSTALGNTQQYTGGTGKDTITVGATTKAITTGGGDDAVTVTVSALGTGGSINAGDGTADVLTISAALADAADASTAFSSAVTGFERLTLTSPGGSETVDLSVLGGYSYVSTAGAGLTLSNLPSGGTLVLTGAGSGTVTLSNAAYATPTTDSLNLTLTQATSSAVGFGTVSAANIETINISTVDAQTTPTGPLNTLTLSGTGMKSVIIAGNAGLNMTNTVTSLTNVDASGITLGGLTFTAGALAAASVIKGSAAGTNTVDFSAAAAGVTYTGGSGADVIAVTNANNNNITLGNGANSVNTSAAAGNGNNTVTGGTGVDTIKLGSGNNVISAGDGANVIEVGNGQNTITAGTGAQTVTVGTGRNNVTIAADSGDCDVVTVSNTANGATAFTTITGMMAGDKIAFPNKGSEVWGLSSALVLGFNATTGVFSVDPSVATFSDYVTIACAGNGSTNGIVNYFTFGGNTFLVIDQSNSATFNATTDVIVKLTGVYDLTYSNIDPSANTITLGTGPTGG